MVLALQADFPSIIDVNISLKMKIPNGKAHPSGVFAVKPSSSESLMLQQTPRFASGKAWSGAAGVRRVPPKSLTAATSSQPE